MCLFAEPTAERAITTRVVNQVPLPAGFKHTVRVTSSKPGGWVQYEAECPVHRCIKSADRVAKLVDIFKGHANCRWPVAPCESRQQQLRLSPPV